MARPIRVLVVDDSAFARKVVREILSRDPRVEVVGIARDGLEALEKIGELQPDVMTLDLAMPGLDGVGVLRALPAQGAPRVVVVSISDANSGLGIEALQSGAVDLVQKPTALATERLFELSSELVEKVVAAAGARVGGAAPTAPPPAPMSRLAAPTAAGDVRIVVIGTSTGGPQALTRVLTALPADLPVPLAVALHIPEGYTEALARRLDEASAISVVEASDGDALAPGRAVIARGGFDLRIERRGDRVVVRVVEAQRTSLYTPSVDVLFESAARTFGTAVLGVVLTGMGQDGLAGARAIRAAGGAVLAESESSCIVDGMPRSVREAGLANGEAPIGAIADAIVEHVRARAARREDPSAA